MLKDKLEVIKIGEEITGEDDIDIILKAIEKYLRDMKEDKFFKLYPLHKFEFKVKIGVDKGLNFTMQKLSSLTQN